MRKMIDEKHQLKLDSLYNIDKTVTQYYAKPEEVVIKKRPNEIQFDIYISKIPTNNYNFREIALKCLEENPELTQIILHIPWREIIRQRKTEFSFNTEDENGDILADYYDFTTELELGNDTGGYQEVWRLSEDDFSRTSFLYSSFTEVGFAL